MLYSLVAAGSCRVMTFSREQVPHAFSSHLRVPMAQVTELPSRERTSPHSVACPSSQAHPCAGNLQAWLMPGACFSEISGGSGRSTPEPVGPEPEEQPMGASAPPAETATARSQSALTLLPVSFVMKRNLP